MITAATVQRLVAVVSSPHDMDQAVRTAGIGIVIDQQQSTITVELQIEGIPKAGRKFLQLSAVGAAADDVSAVPVTFDGRAVFATESIVVRSDVTTSDAEDQALLRAFGLFGPPAILFFGADGKERPRFRVVGFINAQDFRAHATKAVDRDRNPETIRETRNDRKNFQES